jgi:tetratricopeptide (TPR) repeat protein
VRSLIVEKIPFFIFTGVSCIITFMVQKTGGAVRTIEFVSYGGRAANAAVAYMAYIVKMVRPTGLAVLYPFKQIPAWQAIGAFLIIAAITGVAAFCYRKQKYFAVGWLWYIGTLVPVIGLVQVGGQSHADRYTYIPLIGLFIIAAWGVANFCLSNQGLRFISSAVAIMLVAGMFAGTRNQVGYWKDSISLFGHALEVTEDNHVMHNNLGNALVKKRQYDVAIAHFRRALKINPDYSQAHNNLALALAQTGLLDEAIIHFRRALKINPDYADAHNNLGFALVKVGQLDGAISQYHRSLQINPNHPEAHYNLALALAKTGQLDEAAVHYRRALKINPAHADAYNKLGLLYAERGQLNEAIGYYRQAVQINPAFAKARNNLAFALTQTGQLDKAIDHYRKVLKLKPEYPTAMNNLAWILATAADPALRNPAEAVGLAEKMRDLMRQNAGVLDTLAVAYASGGRFDEAVLTGEEALELAKEAGDEAFAQEIEDRIKLFREGQNYIEKPAIKNKRSG